MLDALRGSDTFTFNRLFSAVMPQQGSNGQRWAHTCLLDVHAVSLRGLYLRVWTLSVRCTTSSHDHELQIYNDAELTLLA